jgi:membrane protease YdiL (CAAX protease family)
VTNEVIPPRPDGVRGTAPIVPDDPAGGLASRPKATWRWWEALGVYLLVFFVAGFAVLPVLQLIDSEDLATIVASLVASFVIVAGLVVWLQRTQPGWPAVMGLPERWATEIRAGVLWGLALYPAVVFVGGLIINLLLRAISGEAVAVPEQIPQHLSSFGIAVTLLYGIVIAPLGEEFFFRGVLFRSIRDRHGFWAGALGSGVAFGLIHYMEGPGLNTILLMTVMVLTGIGLAWIYERRGTIVAPMMAHVTFNVIGVALIYALR